MPRINKTEKYAILWLHSKSMDSNSIAKELELTEQQVNNVICKNENSAPNSNIKTKSKSMSPSKNLMITETANKKNHVAIMTKEASMINDDSKKRQTNKKNQSNIFRINNDNK